MSFVPDERWLAQVAMTESNRPDEWPAVMWVARLRWEEPRRFPIHDRSHERPELWQIVVDPFQFSAYNDLDDRYDEIASFEQMQGVIRAMGYSVEDEVDAVRAAMLVLDLPLEAHPFPALDTYHFWSPVSMPRAKPLPPWFDAAREVWSLYPIPPQRFMFAAGVP